VIRSIGRGGPSGTAENITRQGFTYQTVLGRMGLNHMNGRVQDAISGTFISPDPYIPDSLNGALGHFSRRDAPTCSSIEVES
jgi:hypothetical protein